MIDVDCQLQLGRTAKTTFVVLFGVLLLGIAVWESSHTRSSLIGQELARSLSDEQLIQWCSSSYGWNNPVIADELVHRAFVDESLAKKVLSSSGPGDWINQLVAVRLAKELVLIRRSPAALGYLRMLADRDPKYDFDCQEFVGRVDRRRRPPGLSNTRTCKVLCAIGDVAKGTVIRQRNAYLFQAQEMLVSTMDRFDYVAASADLSDYLVVDDIAAGTPVLATHFTSLGSTCGGSGAHVQGYRRLPISIAEAASPQ